MSDFFKHLSVLGQSEKDACCSLRFGTFGPPSKKATDHLMRDEFGNLDVDRGHEDPCKRLHMFRGGSQHFHQEKGTPGWGCVVSSPTLGIASYPPSDPKRKLFPFDDGTFRMSLSWAAETGQDEATAAAINWCRAIGRAALDRYLAFLFLHQETEPSDLDCLLTWRDWLNYGRFEGRVQMRDRAAEVAERCTGGDDELSKRDLIAQNIRALDVWQ